MFDNASLESVIDQIRRYRHGMVVYRDASVCAGLKSMAASILRESRDMLKLLENNLSIKMTYLSDWLVIVG